MEHSIEIILPLKMNGHILEHQGEEVLELLYFLLLAYMNSTYLEKTYGLYQTLPMTYVDTQDVKYSSLDTHGQTL